MNPAHPDVIRHLSGLIREIMNYSVAGIHLDYIRYPYDYASVASEIYPQIPTKDLNRYADFSYDPYTEAQMIKQVGSDRSKEARVKVKTTIIENLVIELSHSMKSIDTQGILSASVLGNPIDGRWYAGQVAADWMNQGALDWAVQMNYGQDTFNFHAKRFARLLSKNQKKNQWLIGISATHSVDIIESQFKSISDYRCNGVAFSYGLLFKEHAFTQKSLLIKDLLKVHVDKK